MVGSQRMTGQLYRGSHDALFASQDVGMGRTRMSLDYIMPDLRNLILQLNAESLL